jgi:hypothetical protein
VAEAGEASASGECDPARRAVREGRAAARRPCRGGRTGRLKANLRDWLEHLGGRIAKECRRRAGDATPDAHADGDRDADADARRRRRRRPRAPPDADADADRDGRPGRRDGEGRPRNQRAPAVFLRGDG